MDFIRKNLKAIGIVNSIAIVVCIALRLASLSQASTLLAKIDLFACVIALTFGLFYSLSGYKKDSAIYFKAFVYLYAATSILSFATAIISLMVDGSFVFDLNTAKIIIHAIVTICISILAIGLDLGKKKSLQLTYAILLLNIVKLIISLVSKTQFAIISSDVSNVLLTCTLLVFVCAKYVDKQSRGR